MKKRLAILLSLSVFALAGCGNNTTSTAVTTAPTESTLATEAVTEATTETATEVVTDEAVDSLVDYMAFVGEYQDKVSQRAVATVTENEDKNSAHIDVHWSSSAFESTLWTMDVTFEDNKLVYSNGEKYQITFDASGKETTLGEFIEMSGYFEWDSATGDLSWTGSEEDDCKSCIFEKLPQ